MSKYYIHHHLSLKKKKRALKYYLTSTVLGKTTVEMMVLEEFVCDECPQILFSVYLFKEDYEGR